MKTLIVEDDFVSRKILNAFLTPFGECDVAADGDEALKAFTLAHQDGTPYDFVCLDLFMPGMNGHKVLEVIRETEALLGIHRGVKVVIVTSMADRDNVLRAVEERCDSYLVKPIDKRKLLETIQDLGLIASSGEPATRECSLE